MPLTNVDLLTEDRPLANQKFVCVSFVSPENILKQKEHYFFEEFVKQWEFKKATEKYTQFMHFLAYKYNINFDHLTKDLDDFIKSENFDLLNTSILDDYKTFKDGHEEELDAQFGKTVDFQTSTRGLKIRGVYPTQEEAELRCKLLREVDPHHDVYVGPVGMWMPWEPEAYKTGRVEYLEEELNNLMHEKNKNEAKAKQEFDKRVLESKQKAIEENKKKALEHGNKLTQNIDEKGNLFSIDSTGKNNEVDVEDIRKELFEAEDVVIGDSDHGYSRLTQNQKSEEVNMSEEVDTSEEVNMSEEVDTSEEVEESKEVDTSKDVEDKGEVNMSEEVEDTHKANNNDEEKEKNTIDLTVDERIEEIP
tara:strand:+ start:1234 stop:2322 length:1089 start_codon:yes stop_codon:yes gene_type:complete